EETSTKFAPWYLIPANDKPFGRIVAFRVLADRLGKGVPLKPRPINPQLFKQARRKLGLSAADIRRAAKKADRKMRSKHRVDTDRPVWETGLPNVNPVAPIPSDGILAAPARADARVPQAATRMPRRRGA